MKPKLFMLFLSVFFLLSCSDNGQKKFKDAAYYDYEDFGDPICLKGEILSLDTIWKPIRIWTEDSLLVFIESMQDYHVDTYHKTKGYKIAENISRGMGPNEQLSCWTLQFTSKHVWAFDMQASTIIAYPKADFLTQSYILPEKTIRLKDVFATGLIYLPNDSVVASSLADIHHLLSVYNRDGIKDTSKIIPYPEIYSLALSGSVAKRIFENRIYYNEKNNRIVLFYVYTDLIDIYDTNFNLLARIHGPDQFIPELSVSQIEGIQHIHMQKDKTKFAYLSGYLTSNEIWALYYGIVPEQGKELQNRIFVYDYNGRPLRRYQLEYPVSTFCIDDDNHIIYGLSEQPDPCVVQFKMVDK
jgi:hypothetical protein